MFVVFKVLVCLVYVSGLFVNQRTTVVCFLLITDEELL